MMRKRIILCAILCGTGMLAGAQLHFANIFSNHMVLQRNAPINVWGRALPGEKLALQFNGQQRMIKADKNGKWLTTFSSTTAGGPFALTVKGKKESIVLSDILVGDVWLCSGQSNMEWILKNAQNGAADLAASANNNIRHVKIEKAVSATPLDDISATQWQVASEQTSGNFTAVGYYFARSLQKELNVPIGLIHSSWGGTMVETWISKSGLQSDAAFINVANQLPNSMEQFEKEQTEKIKKDIAAFQKEEAEAPISGWEKPENDDSFWSSLAVPLSWEAQGLPTFDGIVWYRTTFTLSAVDAQKDVILNLGTIDDDDITYVNGVEVGKTIGWNIKRSYTIPKALLKEGKNTIAVKVTDYGGGGGFYGDAADVNLQAAGGNISLAGKWKARVDVQSALNVINPNSMPALLYNAMIAPITGCNIKGVIWYQGETNTGRAFQYLQSFPLLIKDWRAKFNKPELPFYFVQLAGYNANNQNSTNGSIWAELREAQLQTLKLPHTGMAVTTDIGDAKDIHPRNKKDVGERLALLALENDYGKNIVASGPLYKNFTVQDGKISIQFDYTGSGLVAANDKYGYLKGFMIAGADARFYWAKATIVNNEVVVWNEAVPHPVAVRYGWVDDTGEINLFNKEGLPASPFKTDNWEWLTRDVKYNIGM